MNTAINTSTDISSNTDTVKFRGRDYLLSYADWDAFIRYVDDDGLIIEYRLIGWPQLEKDAILVNYVRIIRRPNGEVLQAGLQQYYREVKERDLFFRAVVPIPMGEFGYKQAINGLCRRLAEFDGNPAQGGHMVYDFAGNLVQPIVFELQTTAEQFQTNVDPATNQLIYQGQGDASIHVEVVNGIGPFSYSLDGQNWQAENSFTNLSAGTYTVYVGDSQQFHGHNGLSGHMRFQQVNIEALKPIPGLD